MFGHVSFNRGAFNRTTDSENTSWIGSAEAVSSATGELRLKKNMSGAAEAVSAASANASSKHYMSGVGNAVSTGVSDWIRKIYLSGQADAVATASAVGLYQMGADYLAFDVQLKAGDDLIIDTERMTILRNNQNFIYALDDNSTFFNLAKTDYITVTGNGTASVTLLWKDRWL